MEELKNKIKEIGGVYLDNLYKEISHYFIIKEHIYDDGVRRELNLPVDIILSKFGLKKDTLFDPIYLPKQLELANYIKENNFEYFNDYHYVEDNYNHYEHGYELKNILYKLTPNIDMVKNQRIVEFEKQLKVSDIKKIVLIP